MEDLGVVSAFFNMGNDPDGTRVGRQSKFYKAWTLANEDPPRKGEHMSPEIFIDKMFYVTVADCVNDSEGAGKHDGEVYSRIIAFHSMETP